MEKAQLKALTDPDQLISDGMEQINRIKDKILKIVE